MTDGETREQIQGDGRDPEPDRHSTQDAEDEKEGSNLDKQQGRLVHAAV